MYPFLASGNLLALLSWWVCFGFTMPLEKNRRFMHDDGDDGLRVMYPIVPLQNTPSDFYVFFGQMRRNPQQGYILNTVQVLYQKNSSGISYVPDPRCSTWFRSTSHSYSRLGMRDHLCWKQNVLPTQRHERKTSLI